MEVAIVWSGLLVRISLPVWASLELWGLLSEPRVGVHSVPVNAVTN